MLLDHGLYRELAADMRVGYAAFWEAIILADNEAMKEASKNLGAEELYPLLVSGLRMLLLTACK